MAIRASHEQFPKGITVSDIRFSQPLYSDYLTVGTSIGKGVTAPDLAELRDGIFLNAFSGAGGAAEQGFFSVHILHDIKPGSQPTFHIHWSHNQGAPSGDVKWSIDYSVANGYSDGAFPAATTLTSTQTAGAQYAHHITDDDDMVVTDSLEPDSVLICRIYRNSADAADTFAADASLIQVDLHYQIGQVGTPERNRPFGRF